MSAAARTRTDAHPNVLVRACREHARLGPSATALLDAQGALAFGDLWSAVQARAASLDALGIGPGNAVLVRAKRDRHTLQTMLALMLVEACYVPVAADASDYVIHRCAEACGGFLLEDAGSRPRVASGGGLHGACSLPAYGIATSGTTGEPKVVLIPVGALSAQLQALASIYGIAPRDRVLHVVPPTFDLSFEIVGTAWLRGATVLMPEHAFADGIAALHAYCNMQEASIVNAPTAVVDAWLAWVDAASEHLPHCTRLWIIGTEACRPSTVAALKSLCAPSARRINAYGLTETTITSTCWDMSIEAMEGDSVPVGTPLGGAVVRVLDEHGQPCAPGQRGRVHVGGDALAIGYAGDAASTADRFRPDPWGTPGSRLFDTRDIGWIDDLGRLVVAGRCDRQAKIGGIRVEPDGIARVIETHRDVIAAAVAGVPLAHPSVLAAWIIARKEVALDDIKEFVAQRVQPYELPRRWYVVDAFPLTPNGKLDLNALQAVAPAFGATDRWDATVAPALEKAFNGNLPDPHTSFLGNGGDSLIAMAVVTAFRRLGLELPLSALWSEAPLAEVLAGARPAAETATPRASGFVTALAMDRYRLEALHSLGAAREALDFVCGPTALQADMLVASMDGCVEGAYVERLSATLSVLDLPRFKECWRIVTSRHDALRTYVMADGLGRPLLLCLRDHEPVWELEDWSHLDANVARARCEELLRAIVRSPLDPTVGPPFHWTARKLPGGHVFLVFSYHHALLDGWSDGVLLDEAFALYHGRRETSLAPTGSYRDLAAWLAGRDRHAAREVWNAHLRGLGVDRPWLLTDRDGSSPADSHQQHAALPDSAVAAIRATAKRLRIPLSAVLRSAVASAIAEVTGSREVVIGMLSSLRPTELAHVAQTSGLMLNLVPLRFGPEDAGDPRAAFWRHAALEPHAYLSLDEVRRCAPELGAVPLIDTALVLDFFSAARSREGAGFVAHTRGNLPCTIHVRTRGAFGIVVEHNPAAVSPECVHSLLDAIVRHLLRLPDALPPDAST